MIQEEGTLFFKEEKENQGFVYGVNKNLFDITNIVNPLFMRVGYNIETVGKGLHIIYPLEHKDKAKKFQIFYRRSLSELSKIYLNLPKELTDSTTEENRISVVLDFLKKNEIYTYIQLPSFFILVKYWTFPIKAWQLTYRTNKERLNRMYLKSEYINRKLMHNSKLEETLK